MARRIDASHAKTRWKTLSMALPGWNNLDAATSIHRFFEVGGIVVLGLLVIFEALAYIYGHRRETLGDEVRKQQEATASSRRDSDIAKAKQEIDRLHTNTEGLLNRTKHLDSRELSNDEIAVLEGIAKAFRGQKFWIIVQTSDYNKQSEQMLFSAQLERILTSAGWVKGGFTGQMYRRVTESGIEVASGAGARAQEAAKALTEGLSVFSITVKPPGTVYSDIELGLVLIDVGLR